MLKQWGRKNATLWTRRVSLLIIVCLIGVLVTSGSVWAKQVSKPTNLREHHAFAVIDAKSGKVLMSDQGNKKIYPASTVKLMTAAVIIEKAKKENIKLSKSVTITSNMLKQVPNGLSCYGLKPGSKYTLGTLLHMTLIISAGDATICSAIAVFGSTGKCLRAMNKKCKKLKLKNTHFDNLAGLDIGDNYYNTYSTAKEVAKFTRFAMKKKVIRKIVAKKSYNVKQVGGNSIRTIKSTNAFYSTISYPSEDYQIIGAKSGTTRAAGKVFSAVAKDKEGHEVICTYMGKYSRIATFEDIRSIFNVVFLTYK